MKITVIVIYVIAVVLVELWWYQIFQFLLLLHPTHIIEWILNFKVLPRRSQRSNGSATVEQHWQQPQCESQSQWWNQPWRTCEETCSTSPESDESDSGRPWIFQCESSTVNHVNGLCCKQMWFLMLDLIQFFSFIIFSFSWFTFSEENLITFLFQLQSFCFASNFISVYFLPFAS